MYEANVQKFHHCGLTTHTTLLTSNLLIESHEKFDSVITVPYFMLQSYGLFTHVFNKKPLTVNDHLQADKKSFLCLNGVNKPSRRFVYRYCMENNLVQDAIFSFHNRDNDNWLESFPTIVLDKDIKNTGDGITWDNDYRDSWFKNTHFNLVTESSANNDMNQGPMPLQAFDKCFFPTEKTFKPIFNNHPFITISDFEYHKNLKGNLGFELYEEIWDYTFDSINAHDERWTKLLDQVNVISKEGIDYNLIKEKLEYNQSIFLNKDNHKITIRNILKQIDNLYI